MAAMCNERSYILRTLPMEIWLQIIQQCTATLSFADMMSLCQVNKGFYHMTMEAVLESDILYNVGYWDPVRKTTIFYEAEDDVYNHSDCGDTESESELPHWFRPYYSVVVPSDRFWVNYLTKRTLGKVRSKPPTRDHMLLRKVAESILEYKSRGTAALDTSSEIMFEDVVKTVCEAAVKYGYIYDRRDFFIGSEPPDFDATALHLDETCVVFRDALIVMAVYSNDVDLLKDVLSRKYSLLCPNDGVSLRLRQPEDPPFNSPYPEVEMQQVWRNGFEPPLCGKSLIRLGNAIKVAVQTDNMRCTLVLLQSLTNHWISLDCCRDDIITELSLPRQIDFLRLAIESGPPITRNQVSLPSLDIVVEMSGRGARYQRCRGGVEISKILEKTTNPELFDVAYDAILASYSEVERVWWTPESRTYYAFDTLLSWGTRRLQRAVSDNCLPIARRLLELGYSLGPTRSREDLLEEAGNGADYMINSERTRDVALPTAVRRGNLDMVELLFEAGAQKNCKNVRKAIGIAMEQGNNEMVEVLMNKGNPAGLLNRRTKRRWGRDLKDQGRQDMLAWLEMM